MIPTQGGERRRRIRLDSTGTKRFQILSLVQNGFSEFSDNNLTYVVAQVSHYLDCEIEPREEESIEAQINILSKKLLDRTPQLISENMQPRETGSTANTTQRRLLDSLAYVADPKLDLENRSFAIASLLMAQCTANERNEFLRCRSLQQRLQKLSHLEERRSTTNKFFFQWPWRLKNSAEEPT